MSFAQALAGRLRDPDQSSPPIDHDPLALLPRLSDVDWMPSSAGNVLPLTRTQYKIMQAWALGEFVNDLDQPNLDNEILPDALTRSVPQVVRLGQRLIRVLRSMGTS